MTHVCGHVVYVFRTWLIVMSHGFHTCGALSAHDLFMSFDWFWYVEQLTHRTQLMDFTLWLVMSHESGDAKYESHRIRVEGRTQYKKWPWPMRSWSTNHLPHEPSSLHIRRLKSQHHDNHRHPSTTPHSLWAALAHPVSCTTHSSPWFPDHVLRLYRPRF